MLNFTKMNGAGNDFVMIDNAGGLMREKCLTTPDDPVRGIIEGVRKLLTNISPDEIVGVAHATTLVTNTLIERKGANTGLLTSEGFRDLLELGSDMRYDMYDLAIDFPAPLVDRNSRLGIDERVLADGTVVATPKAEDVRKAVAQLEKRGVKSVAVCFLHSYRNPAHERMVRDVILKSFPDMQVSISSTVAPEIREYERTVTVVANAYVKPVVRSYLERLTSSLAAEKVRCPILVMLSNGGMTTPKTAADIPVRLLESGPAAGVLSACYTSRRIGQGNLLAFDMGGTTAKACFVDDSKPAFTGTFEAARVKRQYRGSGMPLKVPSVEMIEIGAGGGSIARVDRTGLLKVGPDSSGARPGPVCYGQGGKLPTVTDADLVLGYLDPSYFLGGDMKLGLDASKEAIGKLGAKCGLSVTEAAAGIALVVNQNMATAIRIHAAERGKDYRRYGLFSFGGAGPVHAYEIARILRLPQIVCPLGAGTNSAFGLLAAPVAMDLSRSYNASLDELDWPRLNELLDDMESEAGEMLRQAGVAKPRYDRSADMRFVGQGFELQVPVPGGKLSPASVKAMTKAFHAEYRKIYDSIPGDLPIEALTWRLRASGPEPDVADSMGVQEASTWKRRTRKVYFPEKRAYVETAVYNRYALKPGEVIRGPAVFEERESTVVMGPSGTGRIDDDLNLVIDVKMIASGAKR